jgi:TPP-dependent pyruvate/acetoin dehydrogenase alpha subunit
MGMQGGVNLAEDRDLDVFLFGAAFLHELDAIDSEVLALIERAVAEARASSPPAEADLYADVYAEY